MPHEKQPAALRSSSLSTLPLMASRFHRAFYHVARGSEADKVNPEKQQDHNDEGEYTYRVEIEGATLPYDVKLSFKDKHTIKWELDIRAVLQTTDYDLLSQDDGRPICDPNTFETLPSGECNLYAYPMVKFAYKDKPTKGNGEHDVDVNKQRALLAKLLRALFKMSDFVQKTDSSGATPLLALQVGNQPSAIALCRQLFKQNPRHILATHKAGPFAGENAMHVFIVNEHEEAVLEMIELLNTAYREKKIETTDLKTLYQGQAEGVFFHDLPMRHYGGTVLGFATAFSMARVVYAMLKAATRGGPLDGIITLHGTNNMCKLTGFLPIHVAIANGLTGMYEFLTNLPNVDEMYRSWAEKTQHQNQSHPKLAFRPSGAEFRRASEHELYATESAIAPLKMSEKLMLTGRSTYYKRKFQGLRALQLCAVLGDKRMLQYCLRHKSEMEWKWGPVTQYRLDLDGVDSQGDSGGDVMEIIGQIDAPKATQEMLLDNFMHGFLYLLFVEKWNRVLWYVFYLNRFIDCFYIVALMVLIFWLKFAAEAIAPLRTTTAALIAMILSFSWDLRANLLWYRNKNLTKEGMDLSWTLIKHHLDWSYKTGFANKIFGYICTLAACIYIYIERERAAIAHFDAVWWLLAIAVFTAFNSIRNVIFTPHERLGVFAIVMSRTYPQIYPFLSLLFAVMFSYIVVLYTALPFRFGFDEPMSQADGLQNPGKMLYDLVMVGLIGEPLNLELFEDVNGTSYFNWPTTNGGFAGTLQDAYTDNPLDQYKIANLAVFIFVYLLYVLTVLILMMNLLIALMGSTYAETVANSTLEHRVDFARLVLKLELEAASFVELLDLDLHAGKADVASKRGEAKRYHHIFRSVEDNEEGYGTSGNVPLFDAAVEKLFQGEPARRTRASYVAMIR